MPDSQSNFSDQEALKAHLDRQGKGFLVVAYRNLEAYSGMVLAILIQFDVPKAKYELDLEWMSLGLDLYGDTLQENYTYQFESLEELLKYLETRYAIKVTDIPVKFKFEGSRFPNPIDHAEEKPQFEAAWGKFQEDFQRGAFLDPALKLVYSSLKE